MARCAGHPRAWGAVLSLLLVLAVTASAPATAEDGPYVPDRVLVKFRPGTPASEVARAHAAIGSAVRDEIPQIGVQIAGLAGRVTVARAVRLYQHNPNIEFAEPDYYVEPTRWPNDPWFPNWQSPLQWMGAPEAWDITTGDLSVPIAVLDTGADFSHPDLQGRLAAGWDFVGNDGDPSDENGHGTAVTGVLGAATNNGIGVAGITWTTPVLCVRVGDAGGWATSGTISQGITYAADCGARAINVSFGGPSYSSSMEAAVAYAWEHGAVTVAAAGNSGVSTPYYPAALPNAVAVSGLDGWDLPVYYTNYGPWVDVSAPCGSQTTVRGGLYAGIGGTSISAPYVTGLFGLVFAANPDLTPQQAVDIAEETADDLGDPGFDSYYGWGKINYYQAVLAACETDPPAPDTQPPAASVVDPVADEVLAGDASVRVAADDDVGVTQVDLYLDGELAGSLAAPPYEWTWDTTQSANGRHTVSARARDAAGNSADAAPVSVEVLNADGPADPAPVTETFLGAVGFRRQPTFQVTEIAVSAGGTVTADLTWGGKADLDLYLYSPEGTLLAASDANGKGGSEQLTCDVAGAGAYQLEVVAASGKANYTLVVTHP